MGRNNNDFHEATGLQIPDVDLDAFEDWSNARRKMSAEERDAQDTQDYADSSKRYIGHMDKVADKFKKAGTYEQIKDFHEEHVNLASVPWPKPEALSMYETRGILRPFDKRLGAPLHKSDFQHVSLSHATCPFCDYVENGYEDKFGSPDAEAILSLNRIDPPK